MGSKIEQIINMKNGVGLQRLLDEAYDILGNPLLIFDMDFRLIAYTDIKVDDIIWNEFVENGRISKKTFEFFMTEGFLDVAANSEGRPYFLFSEKLRYNRIVGQFHNNWGEPVADVVMLECTKAFEDDTQMLIGAFCDILSREVGNLEYYLDYGQTYMENLLIKLIEDDFEDRRLYSDHIANIYRSLKRYVYIAVASPSQLSRLVYVKNLMKQTQPDFKYAIYHERIVILFSSSYKTLQVKRELKQLYAFLQQENMTVGFSKGFENLFELPKHYAEAVAALNRRERVSDSRRYGHILHVD